jgi:hypothetical protein
MPAPRRKSARSASETSVLSDDLYTTMLAVFFKGLQAMALGWEPPAELAPSVRSDSS